MREDQQRKQKHGKVCDENEFILINSRALFFTTKEMGIKLVTEKFEDICHKQRGQDKTNVCDKRPFGNGTREISLTEHCQSCCDGDQVERKHKNRASVFDDFAFTLQKREMALGKQRSGNERKFPAKSEECHREDEQ